MIFLILFSSLVSLGLIFYNTFVKKQDDKLGVISHSIDRLERGLKEDSFKLRESLEEVSKQNRQELQHTLKLFNDSLLQSFQSMSSIQKGQLELFSQQLAALTLNHDKKMEAVRETLEKRLQLLQTENATKLEQMRLTVDEKLHATLEKRLGESFQLVSERLEKVHQGLGEMQQLATGVGDLKKVLTNVKTRGVWGEIQLGNLLEQILTPEQYQKNVKIKPQSGEMVEFAIKLPGKGDSLQPVWLPIDAKFPQETYMRLLDAQEQADKAAVEELGKQLDLQIKLEAKAIYEKYIAPPFSTDFAVLFLPIEGLYAEVLRRPGLQDQISSQYKVLLSGPTTLAALLNSLQMGFRTLAIEKRSSEVWEILGAVKTEFSRFGDILEKTQKKIQEAGNTIDLASQKSRTIERRLRSVQELPQSETFTLFPTDIKEGD